MLLKRKYRPEIDGLRAVAVLPVMIFHAGFGIFTGGYVGVDVFFVISGFLITGIIAGEIENGNYSFSKFYERRARRIFPALFLVLGCSAVVSWWLLVPSDMTAFAKSLISVVVFSSNILFWSESNYFDISSELKPLLHTWSLAIEEQFYILFPVLLLGCAKLFTLKRRHITLVVVCIIFLISLGLAHWAAFNKPTANYYLLPTRAWELMAGSIVALSFRWPSVIERLEKTPSGIRQVGGLLGLVLILFSVIWFDDNTPFPSLYAMLPVLGTVLVILFAIPGTYCYSALSSKILVGVGLVSYSAYLWHQPVYAFARHQPYWEHSHVLMGFALITSLSLSYLSWKYVECPFRDRSRISNARIWYFSLSASVLIISVGVIGIRTNGIEQRFAFPDAIGGVENFALPRVDNGWCFYSVDSISGLEVGAEGQKCTLGLRSKTLRNALLFGDSHAGHYEPFWDIVGKELGVQVHTLTTNWCYPSLTENFTWHSDTPAYAQCLKNRQYLLEHLSDYDFIILAGNWGQIESQGKLLEVTEVIRKIVDNDISVLVMDTPVQLDRNSVLRNIYTGHRVRVLESDVHTRKSFQNLQSDLIGFEKVFFVTRELLYDTEEARGPSLYTEDDLSYSLDGNHMSIYGSRKLAERFVALGNTKKLKEFLESN